MVFIQEIACLIASLIVLYGLYNLQYYPEVIWTFVLFVIPAVILIFPVIRSITRHINGGSGFISSVGQSIKDEVVGWGNYYQRIWRDRKDNMPILFSNEWEVKIMRMGVRYYFSDIYRAIWPDGSR